MLTVCLCVLPSGLMGQTNLSGNITASEVWDSTGNPYIVTGNLIIAEGAHISINPGTEIRFNNDAGIELHGTMEAIGELGAEITFTSNVQSQTMGDWKGIKVVGTSAPVGEGNQLKMRYVNGSYASGFVDLDQAYHGPYIFEQCRFSYNENVNLDGGMPLTRFDGCSFEYNYQGLDWCQFDSEAINCTFIGNEIGLAGIGFVHGCYFTDHHTYAMEPYGVTEYCLIENNNVGVKSTFDNINNTFENNTIKDNVVGIEINYFINGVENVTGNFFCDNIDYDIKLLSSNDADWTENCWCGRSEQEIGTKLYDVYDDASSGLITFIPMSSACDEGFAGMSEPEEMRFNVFPNPTADVLTLRHDLSGGFVQLSEISGTLISSQPLSQNMELNLEALDSGVYLITVVDDSGRSFERRVMKR